MKKELLSLALVLGLSLPVLADEDAPRDIKEIGTILRTPIQLGEAENPQMHVTFNHASHRTVRCQTCHHAVPSDSSRKYVSCSSSDECHSLPGRTDRDVQQRFWAYHDKSSDHSCYGCHSAKAKRYPAFKGCMPCHEKAKKPADRKAVEQAAPKEAQ